MAPGQQPIWERMRRHPEENETFNRALAELRGDKHQRLAGAYDWAGVNTVVDVGGGVALLASWKSSQGYAAYCSERGPKFGAWRNEGRKRVVGEMAILQ